MIPALILAAAANVMWQWTYWPIPHSFVVPCLRHVVAIGPSGKYEPMDTCFIAYRPTDTNVSIAWGTFRLFEESQERGHFVCEKPVSKQEFDARIIKWREQGYPDPCTDKGKLLS